MARELVFALFTHLIPVEKSLFCLRYCPNICGRDLRSLMRRLNTLSQSKREFKRREKSNPETTGGHRFLCKRDFVGMLSLK